MKQIKCTLFLVTKIFKDAYGKVISDEIAEMLMEEKEEVVIEMKLTKAETFLVFNYLSPFLIYRDELFDGTPCTTIQGLNEDFVYYLEEPKEEILRRIQEAEEISLDKELKSYFV